MDKIKKKIFENQQLGSVRFLKELSCRIEISTKL